MASGETLIPIYTTRGDLGGFLLYPYLFNPAGEWIGWLTADRKVYSVNGNQVGYLGEQPRILRKRSDDYSQNVLPPPPAPGRITPPSQVPLPPMMAELSFSVLDVLEEQPELLPPVGFGEQVKDMD